MPFKGVSRCKIWAKIWFTTDLQIWTTFYNETMPFKVVARCKIWAYNPIYNGFGNLNDVLQRDYLSSNFRSSHISIHGMCAGCGQACSITDACPRAVHVLWIICAEEKRSSRPVMPRCVRAVHKSPLSSCKAQHDGAKMIWRLPWAQVRANGDLTKKI